MTTVILLIFSNIFMTIAWYGHLKFKSSPLMIVILISWGIAFFEYCLQVPEKPTLYDVAAFAMIFAGVAISVLQPAAARPH